MAWASAVPASPQLTSITSTMQFFTFGAVNVTLNPGEIAHVSVDVNFVSSPTDNATVWVLASPDDGTNYDDTPYMAFEIDKSIDPDQVSFLVSGVKSFKVGVKASGATDTHTSADAFIRKNGVSI